MTLKAAVEAAVHDASLPNSEGRSDLGLLIPPLAESESDLFLRAFLILLI